MFVSENLDVNSRGHLTIGGADTVNLAKAFGTPLYVMDENQVRKHCKSFKDSIDRFTAAKVWYAMQARRSPARRCTVLLLVKVSALM